MFFGHVRLGKAMVTDICVHSIIHNCADVACCRDQIKHASVVLLKWSRMQNMFDMGVKNEGAQP